MSGSSPSSKEALQQAASGQIKQITAFGELQVAELDPFIQVQFPYNINTDLINTTLTGSGTVTQSNNMMLVSTTANTFSSAIAETVRQVEYHPGQGVDARFSAIFTEGAADSWQEIGIGTDQDGFFFGYNETVFGILYRQSGVDTWIPQASWNGSRFDGIDETGVTLDPTTGNTFRIQYKWLGFGIIKFFIENPITGRFVLVHSIRYQNISVVPSVENPTFPMRVCVINETNDSNIVISTAALAAFVEGQRSEASILRNAVSNTKTGITTEVNILTIRNKAAFAGAANRIIARPDFLNIGTDGTKIFNVRILLNPTVGGTPVFNDISTTTSVIDYDTAGTTITGGKLLFSFALAKVDSLCFKFRDLDVLMVPTDRLVVSASTSVAGDIQTTLGWTERF